MQNYQYRTLMQVISAFCWNVSMELWERPLRVDRNTLVKLFSFRKKSNFCQCGHWWTFFRLLTENIRRGFKKCIRRFQTFKKVFLKIKIRLSIIFGIWAKTFQPFNKLSAFWHKNIDKVVRTDFYVCRTTFGMKRCFFPKKVSIAFYNLRTKKEGISASCQKFFVSVVTNAY